MTIYERLRNVEYQWFGVLTRLGSSVGIPVGKLRVFFIYSLYMTAGISSVLYLTLAFFFWLKDILIIKRPSVFDL